MQTSPSTESEQAAELAAELYLVPPARFVATRDHIARQAGRAGRHELASRLRELRRPTQSAWLVNLLVRHEPEAMAELRALGRRLREAQTTLAGTELRRLSEQRRRMLGDLMDLVRLHAAEAGATVSERACAEVESTLNAALVDLAAASAVMSGQLVRPMAHNGFGPKPQLPDEAEQVSSAAGGIPVGVPRPHPPAAADQGSDNPAIPVVPRPAPDADDTDWTFWPTPEADEADEEEIVDLDEPAPVGRHLRLVPSIDAAPQPSPTDLERQRLEADVAAAEAAVREAREELDWFDQHRMVARSEKVAAEMRLRQARAAQRESIEALHQLEDGD